MDRGAGHTPYPLAQPDAGQQSLRAERGRHSGAASSGEGQPRSLSAPPCRLVEDALASQGFAACQARPAPLPDWPPSGQQVLAGGTVDMPLSPSMLLLPHEQRQWLQRQIERTQRQLAHQKAEQDRWAAAASQLLRRPSVDGDDAPDRLQPGQHSHTAAPPSGLLAGQEVGQREEAQAVHLNEYIESLRGEIRELEEQQRRWERQQAAAAEQAAREQAQRERQQQEQQWQQAERERQQQEQWQRQQRLLQQDWEAHRAREREAWEAQRRQEQQAFEARHHQQGHGGGWQAQAQSLLAEQQAQGGASAAQMRLSAPARMQVPQAGGSWGQPGNVSELAGAAPAGARHNSSPGAHLHTAWAQQQAQQQPQQQAQQQPQQQAQQQPQQQAQQAQQAWPAHALGQQWDGGPGASQNLQQQHLEWAAAAQEMLRQQGAYAPHQGR